MTDSVPQPQELFRLAVEASPSGTLVVDGEGRIVLVNRQIERMFGYSREELIGRPVEMLVPARLQPNHPGFRTRYTQDPHTRPMGAGRDLHGLRKDGTEVPVEIGLNPIRTEQGVFVLGSIVDITERRKVEGQLRQSQKLEAVGTLAGGIAHDFNNLLLGIVGFAELARRQAVDRPELREDLDHILSAAERGRLLVQRILAFSRQRDTSRTRIRLEMSVREVIQLLRASLPTTIEIHESINVSTPSVFADETQIHQIVMNLATNASHAISDGGRIEIGLAPKEIDAPFAMAHAELKPGFYACLSVADTGHGMTPEVQERALEPFFTTKPAGAGSGLGLSVVHGIVQSLGGAIDIATEIGKGTRISVDLPAAASERAAVAVEPDAPAPPVRPHVLLVDDEESLAYMMRRRLEDMGYRATVFTSSVEALEHFKSRPADFDIVVTDGTMPRMPGLVLSHEIRAIRADLPILLVSGLAETSDPVVLEAAGISMTLRKPHTEQEMGAALKELLKRP